MKMKNDTNKTGLLARYAFAGAFALVVLGSTALVPVQAHAGFFDDLVDFLDPTQHFDDGLPLLPIPSFGSDGDSTVNNITDSYNNVNSNNTINSNVGSTGSSVNGNDYNDDNDSNDDWDDDDNDNDNGGYDRLSVSCYPTRTSIEEGDRVEWWASVYGGNGNYDYDWDGTDNLSGSGSSVSKRYTNEGTKRAQLRVRSGNQTITRSCDGSVYVDGDGYDNGDDYDNYDDDLSVSCSPNVVNTGTNRTVVWTAYVSGGNGGYRYDWDGTDGLSGSSRTATESYSRTGTKSAEVTVRSNNDSVTRRCSQDVRVTNGYDVSYGGGSLTGSCVASSFSPRVGQTVTWASEAAGGNAGYSYIWSGDGVSGSGAIASAAYSTPGTKTATVTIISGGESITRLCSTTVTSGAVVSTGGTGNGGDLDVACFANKEDAGADEPVIWTGAVAGGTGTYRYDWNGSEGLEGSGPSVMRTYREGGVKFATLTVRSGNETVTAACGNVVDIGGFGLAAASLFAFGNLPFGFLAILIIMILLGMIVYLLYNKSKV
jgi:hypothetical protein